MSEFPVLYERGDSNWGAIIPHLPGCISIGDTFEEVQENVKEAIELHIEVLHERGEPNPQPKFRLGSVTVAA